LDERGSLTSPQPPATRSHLSCPIRSPRRLFLPAAARFLLPRRFRRALGRAAVHERPPQTPGDTASSHPCNLLLSVALFAGLVYAVPRLRWLGTAFPENWGRHARHPLVIVVAALEIALAVAA
jgi:hypothetical protein